jgi:hypothetical protein
MLMTTFRFNFFQTPISGFLGLTIFGFDLFCETLDEAVRPGCRQTGRGATGTVAFVLLPPPSDEVLDVASMLLLGDFRSTISARDGRLVS